MPKTAASLQSDTPPKPSLIRRALQRLLRHTVHVLIAGTAVLISVHTPIFPTVVGTALSWIGHYYAKSNQKSTATAYVVLGGGLSRSPTGNIHLNDYTRTRTEHLWQAWQDNPLPIVVSGVEAPWMTDALIQMAEKQNLTPAIYGENASMNTCENARFSAKLITYEKALATQHVYLVSDWYHMARARRQFARVGIATTPLIAPMPHTLSWTDIASNRNHSRRAFYESIALARDILRPQNDCRSADDISIDTLKTPRRSAKTF